MKNLTVFLITGLAVLLATACTPIVYDSPQAGYPVIIHDNAPVIVTHHPTYNKHHKKHQRQHARIEQELTRRHKHVEHVYRGAGYPGELVEISLRGGYFWHQDRRITYSPISFTIAAGDIIRFPSSILNVDLFIRYENGLISLDTDIFGRFSHTVANVSFGTNWQNERHYRVDNRHLKGARVTVKAVPPKVKKRSHELYSKKNKPADKYGQQRRPLVRKDDTRHGDYNRPDVVPKIKEDRKRNKREVVKRHLAKREDHRSDQKNMKRNEVANQRTHRGQPKHATVNEFETNRPDKVKVVFSGGTVNVEGKKLGLKKSSVTLKKGQTKKVRIATRNGKDIKVPVTYQDGQVIVDNTSSRQRSLKVSKQARGTTTYDLTTRGRVRMNNVKVNVSSL